MRARYTERTWTYEEQGYEVDVLEEEQRPRIEGKRERQQNLIELL